MNRLSELVMRDRPTHPVADRLVELSRPTPSETSWHVQAKPIEYAAWLYGHLREGGMISHFYHYPMNESFQLVTRDAVLHSGWGSAKLDFIVPSGINVTIGQMGHGNIYFLQDFRHRGSYVPLYEDVARILLAMFKADSRLLDCTNLSDTLQRLQDDDQSLRILQAATSVR